MSGAVLFEHDYQGSRWRLQVTPYNGRTFAQWRRWYFDGDTLKPTREGCTIPLERLPELMAAVESWLSMNASSGPGNAP